MQLIVTVSFIVIVLFYFFAKTRWTIKDDNVRISGAFTSKQIKISDIKELRQIQSYTGEKDAEFVGLPLIEKDRIMISTSKKNYIIALRSSHKLGQAIIDRNKQVHYKAELL
ncbi:hypothetical protein [Pontibacillus yanchengensis]|uniref:Sublancin immunity protein SunI-like PH domain-containing protein n=1 Tax=Pontibacillus yanchengensis Y32 TaxID=1385514 RepID=A0A0A2T9L4_9BACI|nr:hypothetical protein [Pontibacillus yanchengensis]KGP71103.1 hypothetical protein N782_01570 [Pontibacillus yanchengensis Y32]